MEKPTRERKKSIDDTGAVVLLSHLPHGFYEVQLRKFLSQFGHVTNLRVGRSSKTGRCKGYAFVGFKYPEVASIVAETMNNYLMFNKLVKCIVVPTEKIRKNIFKNKVNPLRPPGLLRRWKAKKILNMKKTESQDICRLRRQNHKLLKLGKRLKKTTGINFHLVSSIPLKEFSTGSKKRPLETSPETSAQLIKKQKTDFSSDFKKEEDEKRNNSRKRKLVKTPESEKKKIGKNLTTKIKTLNINDGPMSQKLTTPTKENYQSPKMDPKKNTSGQSKLSNNDSKMTQYSFIPKVLPNKKLNTPKSEQKNKNEILSPINDKMLTPKQNNVKGITSKSPILKSNNVVETTPKASSKANTPKSGQKNEKISIPKSNKFVETTPKASSKANTPKSGQKNEKMSIPKSINVVETTLKASSKANTPKSGQKNKNEQILILNSNNSTPKASSKANTPKSGQKNEKMSIPKANKFVETTPKASSKANTPKSGQKNEKMSIPKSNKFVETTPKASSKANTPKSGQKNEKMSIPKSNKFVETTPKASSKANTPKSGQKNEKMSIPKSNNVVDTTPKANTPKASSKANTPKSGQKNKFGKSSTASSPSSNYSTPSFQIGKQHKSPKSNYSTPKYEIESNSPKSQGGQTPNSGKKIKSNIPIPISSSKQTNEHQITPNFGIKGIGKLLSSSNKKTNKGFSKQKKIGALTPNKGLSTPKSEKKKKF